MNDDQENSAARDVQLSKARVLRLIGDNTNQGGEAPDKGPPWACGWTRTGSPSDIVLATVHSSNCRPPPTVVCYPTPRANDLGVNIELWFHGPRPDNFVVELCIAQSGATYYDAPIKADLSREHVRHDQSSPRR